MKASVFCCILVVFVLGNDNAYARHENNNITDPLSVKLLRPQLTAKAYAARNNRHMWYNSMGLHNRMTLVSIINNSAAYGLEMERYHFRQLSNALHQDSAKMDDRQTTVSDQLFTDAALSFCSDLYTGFDIASWVSYDEISQKYATADNDYIVAGLISALERGDLHSLVDSLEPHTREYTTLKAALTDSASRDKSCARQLITTLNIYRWLFHFHLDRFVVVNLAAATLRLYDHDTALLNMRAIVGKNATTTPRFATYCTGVVLYPYWNVPHSIAVNEWLPVLKRAPAYMDVIGMEVIDRSGRVVDAKKIRWASYAKGNFPYRLRQRTGCNNPLGVVKFELTDPFSVYLHDTNFRSLFVASKRYYSNGCIRIQDPVALANAILPAPVDTSFLNACFKDQKPLILKTATPVPVFTVYMTAEADAAGQVQYFDDVYKLLK